MASRVVLDSSAILAAVNQEAGAALVIPLIPEAWMSAVNAAEVHTRLAGCGAEAVHTGRELLDLLEIIPFDADQALRTGDLVILTRSLGLSLGDRACIALALELDAEIYTSDRVWSRLDLGVRINLLR